MTNIVLIAPIESVNDAINVKNAIKNNTDIIEIRADYLTDLSLENIKEVISQFNNPLIITLRSQSQGGLFSNNPEKIEKKIKEIISLKPEYIDIEHHLDEQLISLLKQQSPETKIIRSFHDFDQTPANLNQTLKKLQHPDVDIYKIATQANDSIDSIRMMNFIQEKSKKLNISGHCMGKYGLPSRLCAPVVNSFFLYAAIDDKSVLNHIPTLGELEKTYNIREKNTFTKIYSLIGSPVNHSIGHVFHNIFFKKENINAIYIKIDITKKNIMCFMEKTPSLPFFGFSVTMPLKQSIIPLINENKKSAVNTLKKIGDNQFESKNTDGIGALHAIEEKTQTKDKKILVLGAGGASTATCQEMIKHTAELSLANRSQINAEIIKNLVKLKEIYLFSKIPPTENFDIIINTLPTEAFIEKKLTSWLSPLLNNHPLIMDANYNCGESALSHLCKKTGCEIITGEKMFYYQALAQQNFWFF